LQERPAPVDQLARYVERTWEREIEARLDRLEDARRRAGLKAGPDLLRVAFYSSAPTLASVAAGVQGKTLLFATAASGLVGLYVSAKRVQAEWSEALSDSPVSYLYELRAAAKRSSL
jgi:hypothetical protein